MFSSSSRSPSAGGAIDFNTSLRFFPDETPVATHDYDAQPTISSPLKKILGQKIDLPTEDKSNSAHSFSWLDEVFTLTPLELAVLERTQSDYTCGVLHKGSYCKNDLYCSLHLFDQRTHVHRSKPLATLIADEMCRPAWFRKQHRLIKLHHTCKALWDAGPESEPGTCCLSSCCGDDDVAPSKELPSSPIASAIGTPEKEFQPRKKYRLPKDFFLSKLSRATATEIEDSVSYLHLKLSCYESIDLEVRTREIHARYHIN